MARVVDSTERRAAMSAAVWRVLAEEGLEALSLRAVARAAGCTTGMVLHYFKDRRELLLHARCLMHERMMTRVVAQETTDDPLRAVLLESLPLDEERLVEAYVWLGFLAAAVHDPRLAAEHTQRHRAWQQRILALVQARHPDFTTTQARLAAQSLVALTDGLATLATADPESFPPARQRQLLDRALNS